MTIFYVLKTINKNLYANALSAMFPKKYEMVFRNLDVLKLAPNNWYSLVQISYSKPLLQRPDPPTKEDKRELQSVHLPPEQPRPGHVQLPRRSEDVLHAGRHQTDRRRRCSFWRDSDFRFCQRVLEVHIEDQPVGAEEVHAVYTGQYV